MMEYVTLSNGVKMPVLGYGTFTISNEETERCVTDAIHVGYRSIDTAQAYYNEEGVGNAVHKAIEAGTVKREELFLTTKIWVANAGYEKAKASIEESLQKLQTDYIDLLFVHQPYNDYYGTWRAMEEAYKEGKVKAIGVSNFYADRYLDLASFAEIKPMVNQLETHVFQQQKTIRPYLDKFGTQIEAWAPFAKGEKNLFSHPVLTEIGAKYGKNAGQTALRFMIQSGIVVIPKSTHKERMAENLNVFDFVLTEDEMKQIEAMNEGSNIFMDHQNPAHIENFFSRFGIM